MPIIPFGDYAPDSAHFGSSDNLLATNCVPAKTSYHPISKLEPVSTALDARALGAISVTDEDDNKHEYVGSASTLYRIATATWTDSSKQVAYTGDGGSDLDFSTGPDLITRVGGSFITDGFVNGPVVITGSASNNGTVTVTAVAALTLTVTETLTLELNVAATVTQTVLYATDAVDRWEFAKWNNTVIACNGLIDDPQQITLGGTIFADLTADSIRARHIGVVRDFVVFGNTWDSTDTNQPQRVRWSAVGDETDYTVSATTQSGFHDLKTGGSVQKVLGGEFGIIVSQTSVWRMSYVGSPQVFQFDEVLPETGALSPGSVVQHDGNVYFISSQGFIAVAGGQSVLHIGAGRVDEDFTADLDEDHLDRITSAVDPRSSRIFWAYPGAGNSGGTPNKLIVYDVTFDRWSRLDSQIHDSAGVDLLWQASGVSYTLEGLDAVSSSIDLLPASLDSSQWKSDALQLAAFEATAFTHGFFSGVHPGSSFSTPEMELNAGQITHLNEFVPLIEGAGDDVVCLVFSRDRLSDTETNAGVFSMNSSGSFTPRVSARYHRIAIITDAPSWTNAIGVQIEQKHARPGEGRG